MTTALRRPAAFHRVPGLRGAAPFATLAFLAAGCGPPAPAPGTGPVSVTDDAGRTVALAAPATRVVSLVPSLTECVLALGAGDALVARTDFDRSPDVAELPSLGGVLRPSTETLVGLGPDLVILWADAEHRRIAERLEASGIPVYLAWPQSIDDLRGHLSRLGVLLGREAHGQALVSDLDRDLARVAAAVAGRPRPAVLWVVWHAPPRTAGPGTFLDGLITLAGGRNAFADAGVPWPEISFEEVLWRDPDALVVVADRNAPDDPAWLHGPRWRTLRAVRRGRYLVVDPDRFHRPGPGVAGAAGDLARFLHGADVLPEAP